MSLNQDQRKTFLAQLESGITPESVTSILDLIELHGTVMAEMAPPKRGRPRRKKNSEETAARAS